MAQIHTTIRFAIQVESAAIAYTDLCVEIDGVSKDFTLEDFAKRLGIEMGLKDDEKAGDCVLDARGERFTTPELRLQMFDGTYWLHWFKDADGHLFFVVDDLFEGQRLGLGTSSSQASGTVSPQP